MEMIIHENVTMQDDMLLSNIQQLKKQILIMVIPEYYLPLITPAGQMI